MASSGGQIQDEKGLRIVQLCAGTLCIVAPSLGSVVASGGAAEFLNLIARVGEGSPASFVALVVVPPLAGLIVGVYLLSRRDTSLRGLLLCTGLLAMVILLDLVLLGANSPIRTPSLVGHGVLFGLVGFLAVARSLRSAQNSLH